MTLRDLGMAGQDVGDLCGALGHLPDAQRQRFEALEQHPGIERR